MADEPIRIHIPVTWDYDRITDACAKLAELTGRDFEAEMLAAAGSGELPANGWYGIQDDPAGNLENARHHGARAAVCWDAVAEWLQTKGYDARRGRWIEFDKALEQLQARIAPAPTTAELESWIGLCGLKAYVDARQEQLYRFDNFFDWRNTELPERRLHLWLDSEEVAAFEPPCRWLTLPQLCERWQVDDPKARARLKQWPEVISWPLPFDDNSYPFECVIALESVHAIEAENPAWLKYDAFAPDPQLQWLDLRERERHDAQRLSELMRTDPAGIHGRQRAAAALDLPRLSCWLEPDRIAALYGDPVLFDTLIQVIGVVLPVRRVCRGAAIHVDNWLRWPGRPQTPEGKAGELVRGWLSMASAPDDSGTGAVMESDPTASPPLNCWRDALRSAFEVLTTQSGRAPTFAEVLAHWRADTNPGRIVQSVDHTDPPCIHWVIEGKSGRTSFKSLQNELSKLRNSQNIPKKFPK